MTTHSAQAPTRARPRLRRPIDGSHGATADSAHTQRSAHGLSASGRRARSRLRARHNPARRALARPSLRVFRTGLPRFLPSLTGLRQLLFQAWIARKPYWPALVTSAISMGAIVWMLDSLYPTDTLPLAVLTPRMLLVALTWLTTSAIAIFLLANMRRGTLVGLWLATLVLLYVHSIAISPIFVLVLTMFALSLELVGWSLEQYVAPRIPDHIQLTKHSPIIGQRKATAKPPRRPRAL